MLSDVWTKTLWDKRRAILGWAIGFFAVALIYGGFYPVAATPEYEEIIDALPPAMVDAFGWDEIASPHGYLGSTVYGLLGPALAIIMGIAFGAGAIAGDEEAGGLELLISHPVSRAGVVLQRAFALLLTMLGAGAVVFLAIMLLRGPIDLDLPIENIAAASLSLALLGTVFGALALLAGAFRGRRGFAIGVATVVAVAAFLANGLAPQIAGLEWLREASPFDWFDGTGTLRDGFDPLNLTLLIVTTIMLVMAAVAAFNRRDVAV
jgi:ABC-2 type transport system permease protein